jgi:hypothetical protein
MGANRFTAVAAILPESWATSVTIVRSVQFQRGPNHNHQIAGKHGPERFNPQKVTRKRWIRPNMIFLKSCPLQESGPQMLINRSDTADAWGARTIHFESRSAANFVGY